MLFLTFVVFSSPWIWTIFLARPVLAVFIILITVIICLYSKGQITNKYFICFLMFIFCYFQYKYIVKESLTNLSNDQIRVRDMRLSEYPPVYFRIGSKTIWLPVAHWFEGRKESIVFSRIQDNFFQNFDLNHYFFAGHPRERVGILESEKFIYIFLPVFIIGLIDFLNRKKYFLFLLTFGLPVFFYSLFGHRSLYGEFLFFPFISILISSGLKLLYQLVIKLGVKKQRIFLLLLIIIFIFVLIQIISYEIY